MTDLSTSPSDAGVTAPAYTVAKVAALIVDKTKDPDLQITGETDLKEVGLSSLQIADVVYGIEDDLGVEFDPARAADVATVDDLVALINETVAAENS